LLGSNVFGQKADLPPCEKQTIEKVKIAILCMKRYSWEHGTAMLQIEEPSFWGGGNGWCAAAMAQVIDLLPPEREADRQKLIAYCTDLLDGCISHQLQGGLLYDKINESNFEETTLPAMLAYTIYTALESGWLDTSYQEPADRMRRAVYANVDEWDLLQNASIAPTFRKYIQ
jgi:rhamnogalacturonyl hydrolase YesR